MIEAERLSEFSLAVRLSTLKRLRAVPAGSEHWRPFLDALSFADLAHHLLHADRWLKQKLEEPRLAAMTAAAGAAEREGENDFRALLDALEKSGSHRAAMIRGLSDSALSKMMADERFSGDVSVWWVVVRGNLDHEIHHRGQITVYLRLLQS
jgi:uncharacterized damage-inducible protein DinB